MEKLTKKIIFLLLLFISVRTVAQNKHTDYTMVDEYVKSLGTLDTLNMGTISDLVTKNFPEQKDKARAIFDWIAYNISFDCKAARKTGNEITNTENVIKLRKTTSSGYAALYQDMCSVAKVRCLTVEGYVKNNVEQIGEKPDGFNHTWVVVQLGKSAESWYYVDPAMGSGYTDDKVTVFTKAFNDAYFFADKTIFNLQHYPNNTVWQLGPGPKSMNSFLALPLVKSAAYDLSTTIIIPAEGHIKTKLKNPVQFSLKASTNAAVDMVSLAIGTDKKKQIKPMDFHFTGGIIRFNYTFTEENTYPITILVNNKPLLSYIVEASE